jgi:hypothetical protein
MPLKGEAKKAYQRELMRKRRETLKTEVAGDIEWDKDKYPVKAAWEIAIERVERAKRYAEKFPHLIHGSDLKFQDVDWQYLNEGVPALEHKK